MSSKTLGKAKTIKKCFNKNYNGIFVGKRYVLVHDREQLLSNILCSPERTRLNKVLKAPRPGKVFCLPSLINGK